MTRIIVEVSGGVATVQTSSDEVEVLIFDWDELFERCREDECVVIQHALWNGATGRARRLAQAVLEGEDWPE